MSFTAEGDEVAAETKSKDSQNEFAQTGTDALYHVNSWEVDKYYYKWTIWRFQEIFDDLCDKVRSPCFESGYPDYKWYLRFYPRGEQGCKNMGIYLHIDTCKEITLDVKMKFGILGAENKDLYHKSTNWQRYISGTLCRSYGFKDFINPRKVFKEMIVDCNLTFYCEFTAAPVTARANCESLRYKLLCDLSRLLENCAGSDIKLTTCEGCLPAHLAILSVRSSKLRSAIAKERAACKLPLELNMREFKKDTVRGMLSFLYLGYVPEIDKIVYELVSIADKYDLSNLLEMCKKSLYRRLSTGNFSKVLILAEHYKLDELKEEILNFLEEFSEVVDTKMLEELQDVDPELYEAAAVRLNIEISPPPQESETAEGEQPAQ